MRRPAATLLLLVAPAAALSPGGAAGNVRVARSPADANLLFPTNAKVLTQFMMRATYGEVRPFTAAWAQRPLLDAAADSDFYSRLEYYEAARAAGTPCGAIFLATDGAGALCGFADVGASLWLPNDGAFRLPQSPELRTLAESSIGADGLAKDGVELRPYVSSLVVDPSRRRLGVGRMLMEACEEEAATWASSCRGAAAAAADAVWLEVTSTNTAGLGFYDALGYAEAGTTRGAEVTRSDGGGFSMPEVERRLMRKPLLRESGESPLPLRLRGGWSAPAARGRRAAVGAGALAGALCATAGLRPSAARAFPPPVGDPALLVPLLISRAALREASAAVGAARAAPGAAYDWRSLQRALNAPPFSTSGASRGAPARHGAGTPVVGAGFLAASVAYDGSLQYTAEIDEADRAFCYVSKAVKVDGQCLQRLYTSDRTYRVLLRNAALTALQDVEAEAAYLAACAPREAGRGGTPSAAVAGESGGAAGSGAAAGGGGGIVCAPPDADEDAAEVLRLLDVALGSFEALFGAVGKAEMRDAARIAGGTPP